MDINQKFTFKRFYFKEELYQLICKYFKHEKMGTDIDVRIDKIDTDEDYTRKLTATITDYLQEGEV